MFPDRLSLNLFLFVSKCSWLGAWNNCWSVKRCKKGCWASRGISHGNLFLSMAVYKEAYPAISRPDTATSNGVFNKKNQGKSIAPIWRLPAKSFRLRYKGHGACLCYLLHQIRELPTRRARASPWLGRDNAGCSLSELLGKKDITHRCRERGGCVCKE